MAAPLVVLDQEAIWAQERIWYREALLNFMTSSVRRRASAIILRNEYRALLSEEDTGQWTEAEQEIGAPLWMRLHRLEIYYETYEWSTTELKQMSRYRQQWIG